MKYEFKAIEGKWQKAWEEKGAFHAKNDYTLPKFYFICYRFSYIKKF